MVELDFAEIGLKLPSDELAAIIGNEPRCYPRIFFKSFLKEKLNVVLLHVRSDIVMQHKT